MLVTMFTVVGVALVGRAFLKVLLSWALPPAAALMISGSAMVLVPNIKVSLVMCEECWYPTSNVGFVVYGTQLPR